nr:hypothetical protein [Tanacetum cinerariifolium]
MNLIAAQQVALDNPLVTPENRVQLGKGNMRIDPTKTPKEPTYQVVLVSLALSPLYLTFLITAEICPRLPNQEFDAPPSDEQIVTFIKELGQKGDIKYITEVVADQMHQPWRTFATIIKSSSPLSNLLLFFVFMDDEMITLSCGIKSQAGSENRPPMLGRLVFSDDELTEKKLKHIEANDQAIQTILLGLPEYIYAAANSCQIAQEIWLRNKHFPEKIAGNLKFLNNLQPEWSRHVTIVHQTKDLHTADYSQLYDFLKYNQKEVDYLKAKQLAKTQDPLALIETSNNPFTFPVLYQDQPSFNQNYMQQPMPNPKDITDPTTTMNMALALMAKAFKLNYSTPTNNNQRISSNLQNWQIAQPGMNMGQDRQMQMVGGNANQNPNRNGNLVAARAEGNATRHNGIQLQAEEFDLMAATTDLDEIKEYTELLEPNPEPHQVTQNDNNVISEASCVEQSGGTVEQHPVNVEETRVLYDSLYNNLAIEVEKVNTTNALHLSSGKQIMTLNEEILDLNKQLSMEKSTVSSLLEEKKKLKSDFKIREDELLDKQIQLEKKIKMTLETHNWSSSAHHKLHKIVKDEIFPIVNQVDARVQNFEIQFLKEAAKFVGDFKSIAKEANESLAKHKVLELEIKRLLRAVVSQDIMSVVQNNSVDETSNLQTELERMKEQFENCIIQKEMNMLNFGMIDTIYEIAKLRAQLFDKVSDQKDTACSTSTNTKFAKQSILEKPPKVGDTHALSKPVTSNSIPTPLGSKVVKNVKVIAVGMFRINPFTPSREEKHVPNKVRASVRTNPITVSQPPIITKKVVNSDTNGFSSIGVDNTKTKMPQPRSNTKNDRVPSTSKSSRSKNKEVEVEEHYRKLLLSKNKKHMSSECNNVKLATQNVKSKVACAMCKQCLNSVNHDVCLLNYVNSMTSHGKKQTENVLINEKQKKQQPKVKKTKKVGSIKRLASPKPSKPKSFLRWSPIGRLFDLKGKIIASIKLESQSDCSKGDNACTSNPLEPTIKHFPNSTFSLAVNPNMFMFLGTVRFGNDHVAAILGFDDLQWGNTLITRVYFVEGLGQNLFLVGQFCDSDLEVAFRRNACFIKNLEVRLWHQRLSHLNFDTINDLVKNDLVSCLPKFKYHKEHLCPSCEQGKSKRASHPPKPIPNLRPRLNLFHMDLCGPMRIASIIGKRYVLVILDDYSRYTWVHFLSSKDEAPKVIKTFLKRITILLQSLVIIIRTDNSTEFKNQVLKEYFDSVGISHQVSSVRTPQQNGVMERRNQKLVEAARTMLIFLVHRYSYGLKRLKLYLSLKTAPSFTVVLTKHHTSSLTVENQISPSFMYSGLSVILRMIVNILGSLMQKTPTTSTSIADTALTPTNSSSQATNFKNTLQDVDGLNSQQQHAQQQGNQAPLQPKTVADNVLNAMLDANTFVNPFATPSTSAAESSSSQYVDLLNMHTFYQPYPHEFQWSKDHPLEQVIGEPSRPVLTVMGIKCSKSFPLPVMSSHCQTISHRQL